MVATGRSDASRRRRRAGDSVQIAGEENLFRKMERSRHERAKTPAGGA